MIARTLSILVRLYQYTLGTVLPNSCRFEPTCSQYAVQALNRHGAARGLFLALRRILRCHPWGGCGYDPVPGEEEVQTSNCVTHRARTPGLRMAGGAERTET